MPGWPGRLFTTFFGSKEALVSAYLEERHAETAGHISAVLARFDDPRERLLGVFDAQAELFAKPGFRGCAFVSASAEAPTGSTVVRAADEYRAWVRGLFQDLAAEAGVRDPQLLAAQLHLLYDGASLSARMDRSAQAAVSARAAAAELVDKALATPQNRGRARTNPSRELGRQTPRLSR